MKTNLKVFLMAVIGFLVTTISTLDKFNIWYVLIATIAFVLMYAAKNYFMPSDSNEGTVVWKDIVSGVLIAISMALSSAGAAILTTGTVDWKALWIAVVGAVVGYFTKTIPQGVKVLPLK